MRRHHSFVLLLVITSAFCFSLTAGAQTIAVSDANAPEEVKRQLTELRKEIEKKKLNYTIKYTKSFDRTRRVTGEADTVYITPEFTRQINTRAVQNLELNKVARERYLIQHPEMRNNLPELILKRCDPQSRRFNWQDHGIVTQVKEQNLCRTQRDPGGLCPDPVQNERPRATCWAFAATAAFESSYKIVNGESIDASEQYVINGAGSTYNQDAGMCLAGSAEKALQYYQDKGGVKETTLPYTCNPSQVDTSNIVPQFHASAHGFVKPTNAPSCTGLPSVQDIKQALCTHGPLVTRMCFNSKGLNSLGAFNYYGSGVYYENFTDCDCYENNDQPAHAVVIVGWDDLLGSSKDPEDPYQKWGAWRIKNSWGKDWGEQGFGWISYASNRIGLYTLWVLAKSNKYPYSLPPNPPVPGHVVLPPPHHLITNPAGPQ